MGALTLCSAAWRQRTQGLVVVQPPHRVHRVGGRVLPCLEGARRERERERERERKKNEREDASMHSQNVHASVVSMSLMDLRYVPTAPSAQDAR